MKYTKKEIDDCKAKLIEWLKPGSTIYTKITHVSSSGMSRSIQCFQIVDNEPICLDYFVSRVLGERCDSKHGGIKVTGCGMDMGFHIVNSLSYTLHGFKDQGVDAIDAGVRGRPFKANIEQFRAGYSLNQRWL